VYDALIVGAGHNGLAAGTLLARAGWKVLILESQPEPGGAVRTTEATLPGFRHDLYATNLNAFAGSAFARELQPELAAHGFELRRGPNVFCSVFPDGDLVGVTTSLDQTLSALERLSRHDRAAWGRLAEKFKGVGPPLLASMRSPMPSRASLLPGLRNLGLVLQSSGSFVERHFEHPKIRALWAAWGMHLDYPPHIRGGAVYPYLQCMLTQASGLAFGKGGAASMIDALVDVYRQSGGELRLSSPVSAVLTERGAATGVVTGNERIVARRAVIANLGPGPLFALLGKKLSRRYRYGPGTMMIHLALADLPDWRNRRARDFAYIHVAPSLEAMSQAYREAMRGELPAQPVLVVAQPTVVDPSRAPAGKHVLSIQVRVVPSAMDWDAIKESYADRMLALLERYAPGLKQRILGRCVLSPRDLERANPNLVGGDNLGGSHHLGQQFLFRPFFGWWRYRTPVKRLYMCGAATWPGAGVGAASGYLLGKQLAAELG
jgi:phytoene dehydrogenase-like protein